MDLAGLGNASQQLYGRMMVHLTDQNSNGGDFTFVQADGPAKNTNGASPGTTAMYRARVDGRDDHFMANYDTNNNWSTDCWKHPTSPPASQYLIPKNQWACVEWHFDAEANELVYYVNGNELTQIRVKGMGDGCVGNAEGGVWRGPQHFAKLHLGIEQYHGSSRARTMFIDDVQVDDRYIGCPEMPVTPPPAGNVAQGQTLFGAQCIFCHSNNGNGTFGAEGNSTWIDMKNLKYTTLDELSAYIGAAMPQIPSPGSCVGSCADDTAAFMKSLMR